MTLEESLKQTRPFKNLTEKTALNIIYTGNRIQALIEEQIKKSSCLTHQQYNILRILKGVHPEGHSIQDIKCRMLDRNSDVSRLVDRLLAQNLLSRTEDPLNRRKVIVKITDDGLALIDRITPQISLVDDLFQNLHPEQLELLNTLLDRIRKKMDQVSCSELGDDSDVGMPA